MNRKSGNGSDSAQHFFKNNKKWLDLLGQEKVEIGFAPAVHRLFGDGSAVDKPVKLGSQFFVCTKMKKNLVSFLPLEWQTELERTKGAWLGCENWWAGYPLILWLEIRPADDGKTGHIKLDAEVGPISAHQVRKAIIAAIMKGASARGLNRIQFLPGAADKGRLYSKFLHANTAFIKDVRDVREVEHVMMTLVADFALEFELVGTVLSQWPAAGTTIAETEIGTGARD